MKQHVHPAALALGHVCGVPGGSTIALVAFSMSHNMVRTPKSTRESQLSLAGERRRSIVYCPCQENNENNEP